MKLGDFETERRFDGSMPSLSRSKYMTEFDHVSTSRPQAVDGPFAAVLSRGSRSPDWRANDAMGHVVQSH